MILGGPRTDSHHFPNGWSVGEIYPVSAERVRAAALTAVERLSSRGASSDDVAQTLTMLGIDASSLDRGLFYDPSGAES